MGVRCVTLIPPLQLYVTPEETDAKSVVIQLRVLQQIDVFRCGYLEDKIVSSEFFWAHHSQMLDMLSLTFDPK